MKSPRASAAPGVPGRRPLHVGVDLTPMLPGSANGGSKPAILQFIDLLLAEHGGDFKLTLFLAESMGEELRARFGGRAELRQTKGGSTKDRTLLAAFQEFLNQVSIARVARRLNVDVLYSPFGRYLNVSLNIPLLALITDLLHEDYPASLTRRDCLWRRTNLQKLALSGATFQVPSDFTRRRLREAYGVPEARIYRTYQPIHERFPPASLTSAHPFFFYPARAWPHKNHANLLQAYRLYREQAGAAAWGLVLTANDDAPTEALRKLARELGLHDSVAFLGEISDETLLANFAAASALVFPSRYEGFGIPLLEAMHFGLPIICGTGGSQGEVVGDAGLVVNVEDPAELARALTDVASQPDLRSRLVERGRRRLARFDLSTEVGELAAALRDTQRHAVPRSVVVALLCRARFVLYDLVYANYVLSQIFRRSLHETPQPAQG